MDKPFTDKLESADVAKMPAEYQTLLKRVLAIQADCEIGGPHLYVRSILPAAPTKVDRLIVARTAAEEADHYRKVARLAGEVGEDVSGLLSRPNRERYVNAFRGTITSWEDFAVFGFLIDRVGRYQLEELGHIDYGHTKTAEFAARGGRDKEQIQGVIDAWYPKALDMFGNTGSRRSERYRHWGLKRRTNAQAREEYMREVDPLIRAMGLTVPDPNVGRQF